MELAGKVALVTGGTMGIGAAIAAKLAASGADIVAVARQDGPQVETVRKQVTAAGRKFYFLTADMRKEADCRSAVEQSVASAGRLDVLVHNAGGPAPGSIEELSSEAWRETMDLHVNALFYLCQAAVPHLKKQSEGAIITMSSTAGKLGVVGALAYATAKGAVPQFTRCLARELADANIRVNCIAPGVIRTRFHDDMSEERKQLNLQQRIPLHREGTVAQVADAVLTLVTNDYITGETLTVDGGLTMRIC